MMVPSVPKLPPSGPSQPVETPAPMPIPEYLLIDLEGDFVVTGADEETDLLPKAVVWSSDADFVPGGLVIYKRHAVLEI